MFYGAFNAERNYYTLFAGVRISNTTLLQELQETDDYSKQDRLLIPGSGQRSLSLSLSGVLENPKFFKTILTEVLLKGLVFPGRLQSKDYTISGQWAISSFNISDGFDSESNFDMGIRNSGAFTVQ